MTARGRAGPGTLNAQRRRFIGPTEDAGEEHLIAPPRSPAEMGASAEPMEHATMAGVEGVLPAAIGEPVRFVANHRTTDSLVQAVKAQKGEVVHLQKGEIPAYYRDAYTGGARMMDNSDLVENERVYASDAEHVRQAWWAFAAVNDELLALLDGGGVDPLVKAAEVDDAKKLTWLARKRAYPGFPFETAGEDLMFVRPEQRWFEIGDAVMAHWLAKAGPAVKWTFEEALALDGSPVTTNNGVPPSVSGREGALLRVHTAAILPAYFATKSGRFIDGVRGAYTRIGLGADMVGMTTISRRKGPTRKPIAAWFPSGSGYESYYDTVGLYPRERLVYMVPAWRNLIQILPANIIKAGMNETPGYNHSPKVAQETILQMRRNGGRVLELDWNGFDRSIGVIKQTAFWLAFAKAIRAANPEAVWCAETMVGLVEETSTLYPAWVPGYGASHLKGPTSLRSGERTTSQQDSWVNTVSILFALENQFGRGVIDMWRAGTLGLRIQGDDLSLCLPKEMDRRLDLDRLIADIVATGGSIDAGEGLVFLKAIQPLGPFASLPADSSIGLLSRLIQQVASPENPSVKDFLARLANSVRFDRVRGHPLENAIMPRIKEAAHIYNYSANGIEWNEAYDLPKLNDYLTKKAEDSAAEYFLKLLHSQEYSPSEALTLRRMRELGIDPEGLAADDLQYAREIKMAQARAARGPALASSFDVVQRAAWRTPD